MNQVANMRPDATRCLLLIDDEPAQRRLVTAIGARAGWWVMGAPDIEAAHKLLAGEEGREIDAILLDHWLEGEAGTALIADIRALRPDLPLLILTAQTSVAVAVDAMRAGANDFLVKPIAPDRLLSALNAATDRRQRNGPGITLYESDGHLRSLDDIESDVIRLAIGHYRGRMTEVARRLGIGRSTLYRKWGELGIGDAA